MQEGRVCTYHILGGELQGTASDGNIVLGGLCKRSKGKGEGGSKCHWRHGEGMERGGKELMNSVLNGGLGTTRDSDPCLIGRGICATKAESTLIVPSDFFWPEQLFLKIEPQYTPQLELD